MRDRLAEAIKKSQADYTEVRLEKRLSTSIVYRGGNLEQAGSNTDSGGIVRCLVKTGGWGVSSVSAVALPTPCVSCARPRTSGRER